MMKLLMAGSALTAFTPRTTQGQQPINVQNAAPTLDTVVSINSADLAAGTPTAQGDNFYILSAAQYNVSAATKIKVTISAVFVALPEGAEASISVVIDGNEQFTISFTGTGAAEQLGTITVTEQGLITPLTFGSVFNCTVNYKGTDYSVKQVRFVLSSNN